jgi:hypothetical protein
MLADEQGLLATKERIPAPVGLRTAELQVWKFRQQSFKGDLGFEPRQRVADAQVNAVAE